MQQGWWALPITVAPAALLCLLCATGGGKQIDFQTGTPPTWIVGERSRLFL